MLFIATIFTTLLTGADFLGYRWEDIFNDWSLLGVGWQYSFALLLILTSHEMGHYVAARLHGLRVTLPFYIPLPIPDAFHFGTMGAFIRIKSPMPDRRALMDVGIAGPLAGFVVCLGVLLYGYATLPSPELIQQHIDTVHQRMGMPPGANAEGLTLTLGTSLLFSFFNDVLAGGVVPMSEVYHFPFLFAGWIGLFITALNLLPIGQLDGGHTVYALIGPRAWHINRLAFAGLIGMTVAFFLNQHFEAFFWVPWMVILTFIGLRHPPTMNDAVELTLSRRRLGWLCLIIFALCFIPLPLYLQ